MPRRWSDRGERARTEVLGVVLDALSDVLSGRLSLLLQSPRGIGGALSRLSLIHVLT